MEFKERSGNVFVFDGGYAGEEIEVIFSEKGTGHLVIQFKDIIVWNDFDIELIEGVAQFSDIQTAVNLMQILIKEGLV